MSNIIRRNSLKICNNILFPEYMNLLFICNYFDELKKIHKNDLYNSFIEIKNTQHVNFIDNTTDYYVVRFPQSCTIKSDLLLSNNAFDTIEKILDKKVTLHIYDDNNNFIGYFRQDVIIKRH